MLSDLIENPEKFLGKNVQVYGFFTAGIGGRLFISEIDASDGKVSHSLAVVDSTENGEMTINCRNKYVTFNASFERLYGQFSLLDVASVIEKNGSMCWKFSES